MAQAVPGKRRGSQQESRSVTVNETNASRCDRTDTEGAASAVPSVPPEEHPRRGFGNIAGLTRFLERTSAWLAGALLVINVGDILLGVLFRYIFKSSVIWTEEVARFSLVWLVLLGAPVAVAGVMTSRFVARYVKD